MGIEAKQLVKRLISSSVFIIISVYSLFFAPILIFFVVVEAFVFFGLQEYFSLVERKGFFINRYFGLTFGAILPFTSFLPNADVMVFAVAVLSLFVFNFHRSLKEDASISTALTTFGLIYVAWFFSFLVKIRLLDHGAFWIFYLISIIKIGDAAAYFVGKKFGTHKLIAHISPNKSREGAVAGFVATIVVSLLSKSYLPQVPMSHFLILGIVFAVLSQLGDLAESLLKRDVGVKDSGQIPGLGGILDVLDSLLLTVPILYYYLTNIHHL